MKPPSSSADYCRHFDFWNSYSVRGATCARGIDLAVPGATKPCTDRVEGVCAKREPYTGAERECLLAAEARSLSFRRALQEVGKVAGSADDVRTWGTSGEVPCPNCRRAAIAWSRSVQSGRLAAECATRGCFAVIL